MDWVAIGIKIGIGLLAVKIVFIIFIAIIAAIKEVIVAVIEAVIEAKRVRDYKRENDK